MASAPTIWSAMVVDKTFPGGEIEEEVRKKVDDGEVIYELEKAVDGIEYEIRVTVDGIVKEVEKEGDDDDEEDGGVVLQAELAAKSKAPTLQDIAPYRDALVVYEYRVRKRIKGHFDGNKIHVTHWAIYDRQPQKITKARIGSKRTLELRHFHQFRELESICISDTLESDFDIPLYHDVGQKIIFNQSVKKRYDYRCSLSDTMPAFWMLKGQLRLVVLGDSRGLEGVQAELFYGGENRMTPVAYNLSVTSAPLELQEILIREYLVKLPKLE